MTGYKPIKKKIVKDEFIRKDFITVFPRVLDFNPKTETIVVPDIESQTLDEFAGSRSTLRWKQLWPFMYFYVLTQRPDGISGDAVNKEIKELNDSKGCTGILKSTLFFLDMFTKVLKENIIKVYEHVRYQGLANGLKSAYCDIKIELKRYSFLRHQISKNEMLVIKGPKEHVEKLMKYTKEISMAVARKEPSNEQLEQMGAYFSKLVETYIDLGTSSASLLDDGFPWHVTIRGFIDPDRMCFAPLTYGIGHAFGLQPVYDKMKNAHWTISHLLPVFVRTREEYFKDMGVTPTPLDMDRFSNGVYFCSFYSNIRMAAYLCRKAEWHHKTLSNEEAELRFISLLDTARKQLNTLAIFDMHAKEMKQLFWKAGIFNRELFCYSDKLVVDAELDLSFESPEKMKKKDKEGNEVILERKDCINGMINAVSKDFEIIKYRMKMGIKGIPDAGLIHMHIRSTLPKMRALEDISFGPTNKTYVSTLRHFLPDSAKAGNYNRHVQKIFSPDGTEILLSRFVSSKYVDMISVRNMRVIGELKEKQEGSSDDKEQDMN